MTRSLLALAAIAALMGMPALAADMAVKAPVPPPAPAWSWTGFYGGLNGGYGWGADPVYFSPANLTALTFFGFSTSTVPASVTTNPKGGLFGGQVGYNYQSSNFVAGIEADFDAADIRSTGAVSIAPLFFTPLTTTAQQKLTDLGTLRARLGVTADRALFYVTGGLAYGRTQLNTSIVTPFPCLPFGLCAAASQTQWKSGWTAGGGAEWAFAPAWSLRVEYLHYDLGSYSQDQVFTNFVGLPVFTATAIVRGNIVRGGVNFLFH